MDDGPRFPSLLSHLCLDPHPIHASRPPTHNVSDDINSSRAILDLRESLHGFPEELLPCGQRGLGVPVVDIFRPADDGSTVEAAGNDERPCPVFMLSGYGFVEWV